MRIKDVWPDDPTEDERRFNSSLALVIFARTCPGLHPEHRRRLVSEAIWFWTERGARSRKYLLRYRTVGAWERQLSMGYSNAAKHGGLAHEHVHEKAPAIDRLLVPTNDAFEVLASMRACVVTKAEHSRLGKKRSGVAGWARYQAAGIIPLDMNTNEPMDLDAAVAAAAAAGIWV
jgi:hypothetical protein